MEIFPCIYDGEVLMKGVCGTKEDLPPSAALLL